MAAGFLGRVFRLGQALVSYGLGGGSGTPTTPVYIELPVITVAMDSDMPIISSTLDSDVIITSALP